jgi:outer membrane protein
MKIPKFFWRSLLAVVVSLSSASLFALDTGNWLIRGRAISIRPAASSEDIFSSKLNSTVPNTGLDVDDAWSLDIDFTYMFAKNWGAELLLDTSSKHKILGKGSALAPLGNIAETRVLPPALILQYHFAPDQKIRPYAGLGLNYTYFFDEKSTTSLDNAFNGGQTISNLKLDSSTGLVGQLGVDYDLGNNLFFNVDVKYMRIGTTATFTTQDLGNVNTNVDVNPWVFGIGIGKRF